MYLQQNRRNIVQSTNKGIWVALIKYIDKQTNLNKQNQNTLTIPKCRKKWVNDVRMKRLMCYKQKN